MNPEGRADQVARLRAVICACPNKSGRHACDTHAEQAAEGIAEIRACRSTKFGSSDKHWNQIVKAIAKELNANV